LRLLSTVVRLNMAKLVLIRHGQSTWNAANKFTGWVDVPLSQQGLQEADVAAQKLKAIPICVCFTSLLIRAIQTAMICLVKSDVVTQGGKSPVVCHAADDPDWHGWNHYKGERSQEIPVYPAQALDERFYGDLQGLNKAETASKYGEALVHLWRRSYTTRPPGGESLEDTAARTLPFFRERILSHVIQGDHVLVSAHGNSLRSIIMDLDRLSGEQVASLELATGVPIVYEIDANGQILDKVVLDEQTIAIA
jgi:2,3-bisphosphoglycerate-dependent phosphoglycerate mutase